MDKVFANTWVWVAHASEIPEAGSYKTGYIGRQPVVVVRDRKQQVHVLLNRCRHRAATVCEGHKGKTNSFVCPYHGWSYSLDGALRGRPRATATCSTRPTTPGQLRVEEYAGMIFATFKDDIEPLVDSSARPRSGWTCS
jgi:phenylpropionate dioxygenase-like ring-hydroxylating dioxygenase large terminal subunit